MTIVFDLALIVAKGRELDRVLAEADAITDAYPDYDTAPAADRERYEALCLRAADLRAQLPSFM